MKTLDVKAIKIPQNFLYQPGLFNKQEEIEKWVEEEVYNKTRNDDVVVFKIGDKVAESKVFISVISDESFMLTKAGGKAALIDRKNLFGRDMRWGIYGAMQTNLYADLIVIILRKLIGLHNNEIAPVKKEEELNKMVDAMVPEFTKPKVNLFAKKKKKRAVRKKK